MGPERHRYATGGGVYMDPPHAQKEGRGTLWSFSVRRSQNDIMHTARICLCVTYCDMLHIKLKS